LLRSRNRRFSENGYRTIRAVADAIPLRDIPSPSHKESCCQPDHDDAAHIVWLTERYQPQNDIEIA
jgi:hypothetical protein